MSEIKYHFNENIGKTNICHADKRECPHIHGSTPQEARQNYEQKMSEKTLITLSNKNFTIVTEELVNAPHRILQKTPLKKLSTMELSSTLSKECKNLGMDSETVDSAIALAIVLHEKQKRGSRGEHEKTPYIEHPLRNSLRLVRMGVKDQDIIVAAILHDTVEDTSQIFVKKFHSGLGKMHEIESRKKLMEHISQAYGERVASIVKGVTNDYRDRETSAKMSMEEKHQEYYHHVHQEINKSTGVYLVKISDFIDNATGLYHNNDPARIEKTINQAKKYLPVVKVFEESPQFNKLPINNSQKTRLKETLSITTQRLKNIIDNENHILKDV